MEAEKRQKVRTGSEYPRGIERDEAEKTDERHLLLCLCVLDVRCV